MNASIKGQCARSRFYGSERIEKSLAKLDDHHSHAYRAVIREARSTNGAGLSKEELKWLLQGILLQHARVPRTSNILASMSEQGLLYAFRQFILESPDNENRHEMIEAIDKGEVRVQDLEFFCLREAMHNSLRNVFGISDLHIRILRNLSSYPFLLGDAPAVFYNRYLRDIEDQGVLGILSPGLMIYMPLDESTQVMLFDPKPYSFRDRHCGICVDVRLPSDVRQLNALQVHAAVENVYFAHDNNAGYVRELIADLSPRFVRSNAVFKVHQTGAVFIDDAPNQGEVMHGFETQLPMTLNLSFLRTKPHGPRASIERSRNPELRDELDHIIDADIAAAEKRKVERRGSGGST